MWDLGFNLAAQGSHAMPVWCLLRYNVLLSLFGAGENETVLEGISANKVPSSAEKRWGSANAGRG